MSATSRATRGVDRSFTGLFYGGIVGMDSIGGGSTSGGHVRINGAMRASSWTESFFNFNPVGRYIARPGDLVAPFTSWFYGGEYVNPISGEVLSPRRRSDVDFLTIVGTGPWGVARTVAARGAAAAVRYGPMNAGPLPAAIATTFRGGSYTATTLSEATTLYRANGGTADQIGQFWTRTPPSGSLQATIDLALNPQWGNTAAQVARIRVPAGTTIYEGAAASQGGLVGGGSQVVIPTVNPAWIIP